MSQRDYNPQASSVDQAKAVALRYIDYAPRTRVEVERRLVRAGFDTETVDAALADLERAGLVDDAQFSREWVESRGTRKRLGRVRLTAELRRKGIAAEQVEEALGALDSNAELQAATELARARFRPDVANSPEERAAELRRLQGFLVRRGYPWAIVEQVIGALGANED